ncbi:hypothetical protein M405DRAFT_833900 [Rhizopogon salebrosus TDB-379]|nr:hypothetical protein M405DRAFT_833900 [Rhizopogon salebrosus TDB-379]
MCLLPRGAVRFPESTTTSLSRPSLTAVAFAKARAEPSASPPTPTRTYSETGTRVQRRQLYRVCWFQQTWQHEVVDMRISSDKDVPHHPSTLFLHYGEEHSRWQKQLQHRECVSPSIDPTQLEATFRALYYYNVIPTLTTRRSNKRRSSRRRSSRRRRSRRSRRRRNYGPAMISLLC